MKKNVFLFLLCAIAPLLTLAQASETSAPQVLMQKGGIVNSPVTADSNVPAPAEKEVKLHSTDNDAKTLLVVNPETRKKLADRQERDRITALPGIVSIGISSAENAIRVCIKNEYIDEYLVKYFGFTAAELSNFSY